MVTNTVSETSDDYSVLKYLPRTRHLIAFKSVNTAIFAAGGAVVFSSGPEDGTHVPKRVVVDSNIAAGNGDVLM
jgi:hypothetical protein